MSSLQMALRLLLSLVIMLLIFVVSSESRFSPTLPTTTKKNNTHQIILRDLRNRLSESEFYGRKLAVVAGTTRVSPGGPDPAHHY